MRIEVKRLCECVYTKIGSTGRENHIAQENLVKVFNLPFDYDTIEQLFSFAGDLIWEGYKGKDGKYTMQKSADSPMWLTMPKNISDFIDDNERYWKLPLYWETNLVNKLFDCKSLMWVDDSLWDSL